MDCNHRIEVPLRSGGGKKMKKRRELDALIAHSLTKRSTRRGVHGTAPSQDKLLSVSTDDPEDYAWTNIAGPNRRSHRKNTYLRMCGPVLLGITSALFVAILYWLYFDLRQQIFDYRQKIEEVSAMNKNIPDTLQKWHETSSFLMKNQTEVSIRITELQRSIEALRTNLSNLEMMNAQRNYGKDEKLVADFGAKLEAVAADVEGIKDHYNKYTEMQKNMQIEIDAVKANLTALSIVQPKTSPENITEDIKKVNQTLTVSLAQLKNDMISVNNTLSQKSKMLYEEIQVHKTKLDDLLDRSENITSHVTTLSNSWPEYKQKLINFNESLEKIEKEILLAKSLNNNLASGKNHGNAIATQKYDEADNEAQSILTPQPNKMLFETGVFENVTADFKKI
ncbi:uncharacterized protein LOC115634583 [Scaptodrosophila lebanonensis]|uniref:Uncharacterized protein LOC115634583 n=1 Tax=Drosophila lebanonensis TaxID=7225 RepID=A0A6J2UIQ6_DROLE|nr:uncharacterized protein LOC115634583 [Scaptodrosophila lebanonensis]